MATTKDKSGKVLINEMAHTLTFLNAMGWNTEGMSIGLITSLKREILELVTPQIGEPENEAKDAF